MIPASNTQQTPPLSTVKRSSKKRFVVLAIVVALVAIAAGAYAALSRDTLPKTDMSVAQGVGIQPSSADVARLDKTEAFWGYFKHAAEQQKLVVSKVEAAVAPGEDPANARYQYSKAGIDYATKKYVISQEEHQGDRITGRIRCYDGNSYIPRRPSSLDQWMAYDSSDPIFHCQFNKRADKFNDGINTGGLTPDQAHKFVGTLRDQPGLFTVTSLELVQHNDKPYLHFTVDLKPAPGPSGVLKFGSGWLMMAFRKTGIEPTAHPYAYIGGEGSGLRLEYYVDPATKLPAYSEVLLGHGETPANDQPVGMHIYKNRYQFGTATFDVKTTNTAPLTFDW